MAVAISDPRSLPPSRGKVNIFPGSIRGRKEGVFFFSGLEFSLCLNGSDWVTGLSGNQWRKWVGKWKKLMGLSKPGSTPGEGGGWRVQSIPFKLQSSEWGRRDFLKEYTSTVRNREMDTGWPETDRWPLEGKTMIKVGLYDRQDPSITL